MRISVPVAFAILVALSLAQSAARADLSEEDLQNALKSHICPYPPIDTRGMPGLKKCKPLEPDYNKVNECQGIALRLWQAALKYNKACAVQRNPDKPLPVKPLITHRSENLDDLRKKADEARQKPARVSDNLSRIRNSEAAENRKLRATVDNLPRWCEEMASNCERRRTSFYGMTESTREQCQTACNMLQIQHCNVSANVLDAMHTCEQAAERDQLQALRSERRPKSEESTQSPAPVGGSCTSAATNCYSSVCKGRFNSSDEPVVQRDYQCNVICRSKFVQACENANGDTRRAYREIHGVVKGSTPSYSDDPPSSRQWEERRF